MKVLVVGGGGREHALAWKIAQSPRLSQLYCAPGNPGTAELGTHLDVAATDIASVTRAAEELQVDLVVIGPEAPLAEGLVDELEARGIAAFGPSRAAARLEASKIFAKEMMRRHGIPTADFAIFDDADAAVAHVRQAGAPIVVKADGLAAGKGVVVAGSTDEAVEAVERIMRTRAFGEAGNRVLIETCLTGREVSLIALTDGRRVVPLAAARDHKRLNNGDNGPNTGGMGAFSPADDVSEALQKKIVEQVIEPAVRGMEADGHSIRGALYAGLMVDGDDVSVLEFNVRFGDPETQPLVMRLRSDLLEALHASATGDLSGIELEWDPRAACCVVMASEGYPGSYEKGRPIRGIDDANALDDVTVFQAGTRREDSVLVNAGGRVLGVTALGDDLARASARAYEAVEKIHWEGAQFRTDIGRK